MRRKIKLTQEEKKILNEYDRGEFKSIPNLEEEKERFAAIAKEQLKKDKNINIRINEKDLNKLRTKASKSGLPYQTLVSVVLHKYANDEITITL